VTDEQAEYVSTDFVLQLHLHNTVSK